MKEILKLESIYFGRNILIDISFSIKKNELITIAGHNGSGKTSLLKIIAGIYQPSKGKVKHLTKNKISYMPQQIVFDKMFPLTVKEFIFLNKSYSQYSEEIMQRLSLSNLLNKQITSISGGEKQKMILTRCLIDKPNLILLDEPVNNMDVDAKLNFYQILDDIKKEKHCSIVMASHDLHTVMNNTDTVICLNNKVCCKGKPKDIKFNKNFVDIFGTSISTYNHIHKQK